MTRIYNDPAGGQPSSIGTQFRTDHYVKKALIEARELQFFMPLANVQSMPKNMGKKIKKYHYIPLLDDENINDQGIDASGATIANGNLYGSSKDVGTITGKLPTLTENGGRVNRVGFKRKEIEGTFEKFGFFDEYTQESVDFDTDAELRMHISREMLNGAHELTEDALQIDLLTSAGVVRYAGAATQDSEIENTSVVDYDDLLRLHITLNDNRTPMQTKVISGTRMVDTRTIGGGRVLYCGSELQPVLEEMVDLHGKPAFIPVHQYAAGTTVLNGEIGTVGHFRIVVVPKMLHWEGAGAGTPAADFHSDGSNYNVYPMLVVGSESFSTIGFQTDGKTVKFKIYHKPPGEENADRNDPFGETGFMSIKWYYGFMLERPERIGLIKTAAKM
jgi:N4-gp56 family major capsid protein